MEIFGGITLKENNLHKVRSVPAFPGGHPVIFQGSPFRKNEPHIRIPAAFFGV